MSSEDVVAFGPFVFDRVNGLLRRSGVDVALPPRAVGVLARLIDRAGDVVSKAELLDHVWKDTFVTEVSLTEAISLLRQTLGDDPQRPTYIQTQPRRGYRFVAPLFSPIAAQPAARLDASPHTAAASAGAAHVEEVWPAWLPWVVSGVMLLALVGVSAGLLDQPGTRERPVTRFTVDPGVGVRPLSDDGPSLALTRDGTRLAFVGRRADGGSTLFIRDLGRLEATPVPGADDARAPFFSPDGRWLGFFARGRLFRIAVSGGVPTALCDAPDVGGAVWTSADTIVFSGWRTGGLRQVSARGGPAEAITRPDPTVGEVRHAWPSLTASERTVIFTGVSADGAPESARLAAVALDTRAVRTLLESATFGRPLDTGHLLFVRGGWVLAAPFDADALTIDGAPVPVLDRMSVDSAGVAQFAATSSGVLAQLTTDRDDRRVSWRASESAPPLALPFEGHDVRALATDPRSARIAVSTSDGHRADIVIIGVGPARADPALPVRLTGDGHNARPVWTRDGAAVIYARRDDGPFNLFARRADAGAPALRLTASDRNELPTSVATDDALIYTRFVEGAGMDIWRLPLRTASGALAAGGPAAPLLQAPADQTEGALSDDRQWLAYQSNATGSWRARARNLRAAPPVDLDLGPSAGEAIRWTGTETVSFDVDRSTTMSCRVGASVSCTPAQPTPPDQSVAPLRRYPSERGPMTIEVVLEWSKELSAKAPIRPKEVKPVR